MNRDKWLDRKREQQQRREAKHRREFGRSYERFCMNGHGFFARELVPCPVCGMSLSMANRQDFG